MICACAHSYLGPGGAALGVGDDPDVVRPDLEVVDSLGHRLVLARHGDAAGHGADHVHIDGLVGRSVEQSLSLLVLGSRERLPLEGEGGHFV